MIKPKEHFEIYNALNEYVEDKSHLAGIKKYKWESIFFRIGLYFFILAIALAVSSNFSNEKHIELVVYFTWSFVAISQISMMLSQLILIFSGVYQIFNPSKTLLKPMMFRNTSDFNFAKSLARHNESVLKSVKNTLEYESEAMYSRVGILVGAVDKTGIIFFASTISLAYLKFIKALPEVIEEYKFIMYFVIGLYFMGGYFMYLIYRLKKYSLLVNMAIDIKDENIK